jgi:hypothetical protein
MFIGSKFFVVNLEYWYSQCRPVAQKVNESMCLVYDEISAFPASDFHISNYAHCYFELPLLLTHNMLCNFV